MWDQSPATVAFAPSPAAVRTGTPAQGSRAASAHPEVGPTMPSEAPPHGDPTRRYLNTKVTGALLEGMKQLAKDQSVLANARTGSETMALLTRLRPPDPLRVLGEFLLQKSRELEGTG